MKSIKVKLTLTEEMLGTSPSDPEVHRTYVASKAPDAQSIEEEVASIGIDGVTEKGMTVFPRESSSVFIWDYMIKGFFKEAQGALFRIPDSKSSKLKAYKKVIDKLVFTYPRKIIPVFPDGLAVGNCQRPLRAETPQGPRIALANSETIPAGSTIVFEVRLLDERLEALLLEWLSYGEYSGLGQWRNSGKGRFTYKIIG